MYDYYVSAAIAGSLKLADSLDKEALPVHFEELFSRCSDIQKLISDSSLFLSAYDIRIAQQVGTILMCEDMCINKYQCLFQGV